MLNICYATSCHYEKYVNHFKNKLLDSYLKSNIDIPLFVDTNRIDLFDIEYLKEQNVIIFDTYELQDDISKKLELLPLEPLPYIYYKWNLRRFIAKKCAELGYNVILYSDSDTTLVDNINVKEEIESIYEPNTFKSSAYIWDYNELPDNSVFRNLFRYMKDFPEWKFNLSSLKAIDGWSNYYMGKTPEDIVNLINTWSDILYKTHDLDYGDIDFFIENQSMALNLNKWEISHCRTFHIVKHEVHDRYE